MHTQIEIQKHKDDGTIRFAIHDLYYILPHHLKEDVDLIKTLCRVDSGVVCFNSAEMDLFMDPDILYEINRSDGKGQILLHVKP